MTISACFCPVCGRSGLGFGRGKVYSCGHCGFEFYFNAATAVGAIIVDECQLLVGTRAHEPGQGLLDLPGGFVDPGESLEVALRRELQEELSIVPVALRYLTSAANVYPYKGIDYTTCDSVFVCDVEDFSGLKAGDDLSAFHWIRLADLPLERFAFNSARQAIALFLQQAGFESG